MAWLVGWTRRKIKVVNLTIPDYQMKLIVHQSSGSDSPTDIYMGGHIRSDFADLRFTGPDQVTLLSYWIESIVSGVATVWIKMPTLTPTNNIHIYYDNPIATSISNGTTTFDFFDDFSGDLSKWSSIGTTITTGRAIIGTTTTAWGNYLISNSSFNRTNTGYLLSYDLSVNGTTSIYHEISHGFNSNTSGNSIHPSTNLYYGETISWNTAGYDSGTWISPGISTVPTAGTYYNYKIRIDKTYGGLASWSGSATTITFTGTDNNFYIKFSPYKGGCNVDNVIVRKYILPEPTFSTSGTEELNVTATDMILDKTSCAGPCTINAYVTWHNYGNTDITSFTTAVIIDGTTLAYGAPISIPAGGDASSGAITTPILSLGSHTICPYPN